MEIILLIFNLLMAILNYKLKNYKTSCFVFMVVGMIISKIIINYTN